MTNGGAEQAIARNFDFLAEPTLVLTLDGRILAANASAGEFFGRKLAARSLNDLLADADKDCIGYLKCASGSTAPRPGKFTFAGDMGTEQFRTQAARLRQKDVNEVQVILRLLSLRLDRFALLDRRVKDLDAQLHQRLHENAALQESLRQNRTLVRELQHRVKNNIQVMMSLIKMSAQARNTPEVAAVVETAHGRLRAIAAAQEALYQANEADTVPARSFLEDIVRNTARSHGVSSAVSLSLEHGELSSEEAHCLALIANELITNAVKYGLRDGLGRIEVSFAAEDGGYRFEVENDGPVIPVEAGTRSSGLALVRGLCRQIGGRLEIGGRKGAKCSIHFRSDKQERKMGDARFSSANPQALAPRPCP